MMSACKTLALAGWGQWQCWRRGRPVRAYAFLGSLGDELLCTAIYAEWQKRGVENIWVMTRHPEFYQHLAPSRCLLPEFSRYVRYCESRGIPFHYVSYSSPGADPDRDTPVWRPLIAEICARAGLSGQVSLRPHLRLQPAEIARQARFAGAIAMQSASMSAAIPMRNKQWPAERMQALAEQLIAARHLVVQLGLPSDPPLVGAIDLRGRTNLRETAAVLQQARLFVGLAGFQMHLARAVDCPAVIVYGGREPPALTGYSCNINLTATPPCAPCWQRNRCDFDRQCLTAITVDAVREAVDTLLLRPREQLVLDQWDL